MIDKLKGMLKSKTMLFALALGVFGAIQDHIDALQPYLGSKYGVFTMLVSVVVAALRWTTTQALEEK